MAKRSLKLRIHSLSEVSLCERFNAEQIRQAEERGLDLRSPAQKYRDALYSCSQLWNFLVQCQERSNAELFGGRNNTVYASWLTLSKDYLGECYSWSTADMRANVVNRFARAMDKHYKNPKQNGLPKYRHPNDYQSFTCNNKKNISFNGKDLCIGKLPSISKSEYSFQGKPKWLEIKDKSVSELTFKKYRSGWLVSVVYDIPDYDPKQKTPISELNSAGLDAGLTSLATLSTDEYLANIRAYQSLERRLKIRQRRLSKKSKGSGQWHKAKRIVRATHTKIINRRKGHNHMASAKIVMELDYVFVEDGLHQLCENLYRQGKKFSVHKHWLDAAIGQLFRQLEYKLSAKGGQLVKVPKEYGSQTCSKCGCRKTKHNYRLPGQDFVCDNPSCQLILDGDVNASRVLQLRGLTKLALEEPNLFNALSSVVLPQTLGEVTPVKDSQPYWNTYEVFESWLPVTQEFRSSFETPLVVLKQN